MVGFAMISLKCFLSSSFVFVNNHIVFIIVIRVDVYHVINTTIAKMCTIKVVKLIALVLIHVHKLSISNLKNNNF